jgi:hypothetical protein
MFGQIGPGVTTTCGANSLYPTYKYFYVEVWPIITTLTITIIPASCMIFFVIAITINVKHSRDGIKTNIRFSRFKFLYKKMLL